MGANAVGVNIILINAKDKRINLELVKISL